MAALWWLCVSLSEYNFDVKEEEKNLLVWPTMAK